MDRQDRAQWTVLVVDDDAAHRYATQKMLASRGYRTLEAADGPRALELASQADAVVLDIAMPTMSGLDVCAALRAADPDLSQDTDLIIIQYSGVFTSAADEVAGLRGGADAYLTKAGDSDVLLANLDAQIRKRERLRRLEAERQAAMDREEQARDLFMAILGHDLRGPMQAVTMGANVLLRSPDASALTLRTAARILGSGLRITEMLDDLRDYALVKVGSGLELHREPVDLGQLLRSCVDEAQVTYPGATIELRGTAPRGSWDRGRVFRLVMNLLRNAVQHGTQDAPVSVNVGEEAGLASLQVVNAGSAGTAVDLGGEATLLAGASDRKANGNLGLGLYICKQIVQAHGGDIALTSDAHSTVVTVRLPLQPPSSCP